MTAFVFPLVVALVAIGVGIPDSIGAQVAPSCGVGPTTVLSDSGIGKLRVGVSRAEISRLCRVIKDTIVASDDYVEMERALVIDLGRDTVVAVWGLDSTINRIDVDRDRFRTRDGLHVGISLRSLMNRPGLSAGIGETSVWASVTAHCGITMVLSGTGEGAQGDEFTRDQLAKWPPSIYVTTIVIHGCRNGSAG